MTDAQALQTQLDALKGEMRQLKAYEAVRQCIFGYARAMDRLDRSLLESQFWSDAHVDYGAFYKGSISGFLDVAMHFQGGMRDTQHFIGNISVELAGSQAFAESYVHAHHILVDGDNLSQLLVGARYLDRFEQRDSQWRLTFRAEVLDWGRLLPVPERWFETSTELPKGVRGPADLSYSIADLAKRITD